MIKSVLNFLKLPFKLYYRIIKPHYLVLNKFHYNSPLERIFIKKLNRYKIKWQPKNRKIVLTQVVDDHSMCIKLAAATHLIASKNTSNIALYSVATKLENKILRSQKFWDRVEAEIHFKRLTNVFLSFGGKIVHRNVYDYHDRNLINTECKKIRKTISKKEDIVNIHIENICVGDLIYDTYLRFKNKPTVDINDDFLTQIIIECLNIYYNFNELTSKYQVTALVNSYTTYIHHGIAVRVCLSKNIPVYTVGSDNSLLHKVSKEYPSHHNNHSNFKSLFNKLENKSELLKIAKQNFEKRFEGHIDSATSFMKQSAFSNYFNPELEKYDWKNTVVILAHSFFDAPHTYINLLFPDFYEWTIYTLDVLSKQKELTVLMKQHPNSITSDDDIFAQLKTKYANTNIHFIDKKTSQLQIINSRPKLIITAYGTASYEFAYYSIPVLSNYNNPFTGYHFTHVAKTIEQYNRLLNFMNEIETKPDREEILSYYYMQHLFFLKGRDNDYLGFIKFKHDTKSDEFLKQYLPLMDESYFKMHDSAIKDGYELTQWEYEQIEHVIE